MLSGKEQRLDTGGDFLVKRNKPAKKTFGQKRPNGNEVMDTKNATREYPPEKAAPGPRLQKERLDLNIQTEKKLVKLSNY